MEPAKRGSSGSPGLRRVVAEDAIGQLRRGEGQMATLGREGDALKLDWVEGVARLLADGALLERVEAEARELWDRGMRHVIWAGMGGSVLTVRVLCALGFGDGERGERVALHPLDSTDPAALNAVVRALAAPKGLALPAPGQPLDDPSLLRALLSDVLMVGVAMGMTSEEPITHLAWFTELLERAHLPPAEHLLVMTLPDSYLDQFAREHGAPSLPLQPDGGTGTGGRMSAPTTRVFLLPAALFLTRAAPEPGQLRAVLRRAWEEYDFARALARPAHHPFVLLGAALSDASVDGACRLLLRLPPGWDALIPWIEQLMEESLGKGGKGVVVFGDQRLHPQAPGYRTSGTLRVRVVSATNPGPGPDQRALGAASQQGMCTLPQPALAAVAPTDRLAALAASFLGWQLSMAVYGYLQSITFAGQPAVENYKARARTLRQSLDPVRVALEDDTPVTGGALTLLGPRDAGTEDTPASIFAAALRRALAAPDARTRLGYLDLTINGEAPAPVLAAIHARLAAFGNQRLGVPVKLRRAPADYHSTEQSEMDGPPALVSLRLLARAHEPCMWGQYTPTFLEAQAVSTWQAMLEQERPCFLLLLEGTLDGAAAPLEAFFREVEEELRGIS